MTAAFKSGSSAVGKLAGKNRPQKRGRGKASEHILKALTWGAAGFSAAVLVFLVAFILIKGIPHIRLSLFSAVYTSENVSLTPALISTCLMTALSLAIAVPLGVCAAIWLVEYAKRGSTFVGLIRLTAETLAGIPSIVYGLFGLLFFVTFLGWGFSVLSGAFTLSVMILPLILRSSEEALASVPDIWREGAFALGAGKLRAVFKIVLPASAPGILAGLILAIGRIVGETAALIYTAGTVAQIPHTTMQSARTLSVHMYALSSEGFHSGEAFATAAVLLVLVVLINTASAALTKLLFSKNDARGTK
ncbi:MAG: phosphate ABC transporter permease PstA [Spirochaetaceae bacterium]|jgi:phosphate transport system permease protein|nr:phosphate ABC transporter permease PstA [Spirochaetaceae bacterium]